ncbi:MULTISPECIES: GntR family transcriptional regulator [unclassified Spirosoma]|uniref:GntR family transcriptional regulator n=1 Tax=unclassified Spirosoma TaxID=2621999 RepID=UPI00095FF52B|nr:MULTISPECIES: GntR family transcriptional regulator [unclassified Spirosoma]MBN8825781.1 GntR family transcriptional regulator [Spirosoma sp.]OJW74375.1 MAG: GntR family transcriptional regulator [Spirosoma sp. 48-14]
MEKKRTVAEPETHKAKFIALSESIIDKIKRGELQPGDQIPSENELIKTYHISNTTARKTLLEIESKGWARRIKGKGTYVLNRTEDHHLLRTLGSIYATRRGFHDSLIAEGFTPKNIVLEKTILQDGISSEINGRHFIIDGPVMKLHQLRYADELLIKDEVKYISLTLCPKINRLPTEISYFKVYEDNYRLKIAEVQQTLGVKILEPNTTNFDLSKPTPVFVLDSAVICTGDQIVEIEQSYYHGDKYKFAVIANTEQLQRPANPITS